MWTGQAHIRPGWAVFRGTAGDHAQHRHHAVQVAVGLEGPIEIWAQQPGKMTAPGAVIAADCPHQLASGPDPLVLLYLERESEAGRKIDAWCEQAAKPLTQAQSAHVRARLAAVSEPVSDVLQDVWLRLQQALAEIARGSNLTEAAYAAGFADSAHLSRSFRQTFGIAPNVLLHPALSVEARTR